MYIRVQAVFYSISGPHTRSESERWNLQTEAAICSLFGIEPTDPHGFFTDATGTDYQALERLREKARLAAGDCAGMPPSAGNE